MCSWQLHIFSQYSHSPFRQYWCSDTDQTHSSCSCVRRYAVWCRDSSSSSPDPILKSLESNYVHMLLQRAPVHHSVPTNPRGPWKMRCSQCWMWCTCKTKLVCCTPQCDLHNAILSCCFYPYPSPASIHTMKDCSCILPHTILSHPRSTLG